MLGIAAESVYAPLMTRAALLACLLLAACSRDKAHAGGSVGAAPPSASAAAPSTASATTSATTPEPEPSAAPSATQPAASARAAASAAPPAKGKAPTSLVDFLPASLAGTPLDRHLLGSPLMAGLPGGAAIGSYLDLKHHKAININLMPVQDLATARAQLHGLKPGQTKKAPAAGVVFKAFNVKGFTVVRTQYLTAQKSEAEALIAGKVNVRLSVQPTRDPDEAVTLIKQVDLRGIAAFAKKHL